MRAYQYIDPTTPKSGRLFNKLNDTVHSLAMQNTETVGVSFLMQYLSSFFELTAGRQLTKQQRKDIVKILEDKVTQGKINEKQPNYTSDLAKIVIKDHSQIIRQALCNKLKYNVRRLGHDEVEFGLKALRISNFPEEEMK